MSRFLNYVALAVILLLCVSTFSDAKQRNSNDALRRYKRMLAKLEAEEESLDQQERNQIQAAALGALHGSPRFSAVAGSGSGSHSHSESSESTLIHSVSSAVAAALSSSLLSHSGSSHGSHHEHTESSHAGSSASFDSSGEPTSPGLDFGDSSTSVSRGVAPESTKAPPPPPQPVQREPTVILDPLPSKHVMDVIAGNNNPFAFGGDGDSVDSLRHQQEMILKPIDGWLDDIKRSTGTFDALSSSRAAVLPLVRKLESTQDLTAKKIELYNDALLSKIEQMATWQAYQSLKRQLDGHDVTDREADLAVEKARAEAAQVVDSLSEKFWNPESSTSGDIIGLASAKELQLPHDVPHELAHAIVHGLQQAHEHHAEHAESGESLSSILKSIAAESTAESTKKITDTEANALAGAVGDVLKRNKQSLEIEESISMSMHDKIDYAHRSKQAALEAVQAKLQGDIDSLRSMLHSKKVAAGMHDLSTVRLDDKAIALKKQDISDDIVKARVLASELTHLESAQEALDLSESSHHHSESSHGEHSESAHHESGHHESAKLESGYYYYYPSAESANKESSHHESAHHESSHHESSHHESAHHESSHHESAHHESAHESSATLAKKLKAQRVKLLKAQLAVNHEKIALHKLKEAKKAHKHKHVAKVVKALTHSSKDHSKVAQLAQKLLDIINHDHHAEHSEHGKREHGKHEHGKHEHGKHEHGKEHASKHEHAKLEHADIAATDKLLHQLMDESTALLNAALSAPIVAHHESSHHESSHHESSHHESSHHESAHHESSHPESSHHESTHEHAHHKHGHKHAHHKHKHGHKHGHHKHKHAHHKHKHAKEHAAESVSAQIYSILSEASAEGSAAAASEASAESSEVSAALYNTLFESAEASEQAAENSELGSQSLVSVLHKMLSTGSAESSFVESDDRVKPVELETDSKSAPTPTSFVGRLKKMLEDMTPPQYKSNQPKPQSMAAILLHEMQDAPAPLPHNFAPSEAALLKKELEEYSQQQKEHPAPASQSWVAELQRSLEADSKSGALPHHAPHSPVKALENKLAESGYHLTHGTHIDGPFASAFKLELQDLKDFWAQYKHAPTESGAESTKEHGESSSHSHKSKSESSKK